MNSNQPGQKTEESGIGTARKQRDSCHTVRIVRKDLRNKESCWLSEKMKKLAESQYGEDGILESLFDVIGRKNKWCVEFGAWDGRRYSNTYHLIQNNDWSGVLIEGNRARFESIKGTFGENERVHGVCGLVGFDPENDTIDYYLRQTPIPNDFDLISIDIDGNDWHIWNSIVEFRPRVVLIEFNAKIPNDVVYIQERNFQVNQGCSLLALIELGKEKGYELAAVSPTNGIFVVKEEFPKLNIPDNSIDAMFHTTGGGRLFHLFDGTVVNVGLPAIALRQRKPDKRLIGPFDFQIYPKERRFYGGNVPPEDVTFHNQRR